jgi:tellurite resistance protein
MGLFDKLTGGNSDAPLNKQEGFAAIMLAVVAADGDISDEESEDFVARLNRMRLFTDGSGDQTRSVIEKVFRIKSRGGVEALVEKGAPALTPELRETAFAVAVDMAFADGSIEPAEEKMLEKLQAALGIPDDMASAVVDVMVIKNRG